MSRVLKPDSGQTLVLQDEGGSAALTIETDGDVNLTQDIYLASGKGIYFDGGTTSANYLGGSDAYEEGIWTASFTGTSDTATGYYTKIGSVVHIQVYSGALTMSSATTSKISGLPFASGVSDRYGTVALTHNTYAPNADNAYIIDESGDYIYPVLINSTGNVTTPSTGTKYIIISGTYMTNS